MMVAISLLSGMYDLSSLIMIFVLDALMNLLGIAMEQENLVEVIFLILFIGFMFQSLYSSIALR